MSGVTVPTTMTSSSSGETPGEDRWFLGAHGFAAIEAGHVAQGRQLVERSMQLNPRSANGAHITLHAHYEANEDGEALAFIEAWLPDYSREGPMHCHLLARCAVGVGGR